jgi:flagellin
MSLRINTNVAALNSYNNLSANQTRLESAFQQLSSGLRINKAADDAAGLSIAQGLTSQINGLTQAVSNANDGINVAQIADGALGTVQDILQRMRGLVVKAGNEGTQDAKSLEAIQKEVKNLNTQLDNIGKQTKFGQTDLLGGDGTFADRYDKNFQVGANGGDTIKLDLSGATISSKNLGREVDNASAPTAWHATKVGIDLSSLAIAKFDDAADFTYSTFDAAAGTTTTTANGGVVANKGIYNSAMATDDLSTINSAIDKVSGARSQIGAVQNQLNYTVTNLQTAITNVTASRSNLTDADLAQQVTAMTQSQILTQAATSVLAQANSAPQAILKLLQ